MLKDLRRSDVAIALRKEKGYSYKTYTDYVTDIMELSGLCRGTHRSNCIGTALYITGERSCDRYVDTYKAHPILARLWGPFAKPTPFCLISWEKPNPESSDGIEVSHFGIVTSVEPLLVTNRFRVRGTFTEDMPFEEANTASESRSVCYYLPRALARLIILP
jgi:hypothetical protein